MALFSPGQMFRDVTRITPDYLAAQGIKALVLDVDNTLTGHGSQELPTPVSAWLDGMKAAGIRLMIASNNVEKRVAPFAARVGLDFTAFSCKPAPFGLARAQRALGVEKSQMALVGDQIFTDAMAANLYGIRMLLVVPLHKDEKWTIRLKRWFEQPVLRRYFARGGTIL